MLRDLGRILREIVRLVIPIGGLMQLNVHFTARTMSCARITLCLLVRASFTALSCLIFDLDGDIRKG